MRARVLVVDDQPDTTAVFTVLFGLLGQEARTALRGRHAIRLAREFDPDLVILDIGLPDVSGYEVARALRAAPHGKQRFIAAITGRAPCDGESNDAFDSYLVKPVDLAALKGLLRAVLERMQNTPN